MTLENNGKIKELAKMMKKGKEFKIKSYRSQAKNYLFASAALQIMRRLDN